MPGDFPSQLAIPFSEIEAEAVSVVVVAGRGAVAPGMLSGGGNQDNTKLIWVIQWTRFHASRPAADRGLALSTYTPRPRVYHGATAPYARIKFQQGWAASIPPSWVIYNINTRLFLRGVEFQILRRWCGLSSCHLVTGLGTHGWGEPTSSPPFNLRHICN